MTPETSQSPTDAGPGGDRGDSRGIAGRVWRTAVSHPIAALVVVAAIGTAGIVVTYTTDSSVTTASTEPPVQYAAGADAGPSTLGDYVTAYTISTNKTNIDSTVKGVPEGNLTIDSYFKLTNNDDQTQSVTLSTAQVSNANVNDYSIVILDSTDKVQAHLDLQAASPSASFDIPTSTTYHAKLYLELASGTTDSDLGGGLAKSISLSVS